MQQKDQYRVSVVLLPAVLWVVSSWHRSSFLWLILGVLMLVILSIIKGLGSNPAFPEDLNEVLSPHSDDVPKRILHVVHISLDRRKNCWVKFWRPPQICSILFMLTTQTAMPRYLFYYHFEIVFDSSPLCWLEKVLSKSSLQTCLCVFMKANLCMNECTNYPEIAQVNDIWGYRSLDIEDYMMKM